MAQFTLPKIPETQTQVSKRYAIIDAAHHEDIYTYFTSQTELEYKSLFDSTIHIESACAGPLLIKIKPTLSKVTLDTLANIQTEYSAIVWLWSDYDLDLVLQQLKQVLFAIQDEKEVLCRYYDSRCIKSYLEIFSKIPSLDQWRKIIPLFAVWRLNDYEYLSSSSTTPPANKGVLV